MTERARRQIAQARQALGSMTPGDNIEEIWRTIGGVEALLDLALQELPNAAGKQFGGLRADDVDTRSPLDAMRKL